MNINVSIIIPVHNRKLITQKILSQLSLQINEYTNSSEDHFVIEYQILVVDDGSIDGTSSLIRQEFSSVKIIKGNGNLWWTGAIVKGMEYAIANLKPDYFLWLNDDLILSSSFIRELSLTCYDLYKLESQDIDNNSSSIFANENLEKNSKGVILGGIVMAEKYPDWIAFGGIKEGIPVRSVAEFSRQNTKSVDRLSGNIFLFSKKVSESIGLPDCKRFQHYGGDMEYSIRGQKKEFLVLLYNKLKASCEYEVEDIIRYLPVWMQWYLASNLKEKWKLITGLTNLKNNYNIWYIVNKINFHSPLIPKWKYWFFYCKKLIQFLIVSFSSNQKIQTQIEQHLQKDGYPPKLIKEIKSRFWEI